MKLSLSWLAGRRPHLALNVLSALVLVGSATAEDELRPDVLELRDAGTLAGHLVSRDGGVVVFVSVDAEVRLPEGRLQSLEPSSEGESELYLGRQLLGRRKWDDAERWLRKAAECSAWKGAAEKALDEVKAGRQQEEEDRRNARLGFLTALIDRGSYKQSLRLIDKWAADGDDIWAGERGRIHLVLARNAVDHLEYRVADFHLNQANLAGMTSPEWQRLRAEVDSWYKLGHSEVPPKIRIVTPPSPVQFFEVRQAVESLGTDVNDELIRLAHTEASAAGLDPLLVCAVIQAESAWNPKARSPKGAMGLMQLMPITAKEMGIANPMDPVENVKGGVRYLRGLLDLYKESAQDEQKNLELALGAYNAGPARIAEYKGLPPFKETRTYIRRVTGFLHQLRSATGSSTAS